MKSKLLADFHQKTLIRFGLPMPVVHKLMVFIPLFSTKTRKRNTNVVLVVRMRQSGNRRLKFNRSLNLIQFYFSSEEKVERKEVSIIGSKS